MRHLWWALTFAMALSAGCNVPRDQLQTLAAPAGSLAPASDSTSKLSGLDLLLNAAGGHRLVFALSADSAADKTRLHEDTQLLFFSFVQAPQACL